MIHIQRIQRSIVVGILISISSFGMLLVFNSQAVAQSDDPKEDVCLLQEGATFENGVCKLANEQDGVGGLFNTVSNTLLFIVGAVSVIMLIIGGIRYTVSGGDQNAVAGAKNTILYATVGIVVSFLAYAAVNFVIKRLQ